MYSESDNAFQRFGHLNFLPKCVNGPEEWTEVGRWSVGRSVVNIHTSYTDLIYSSFATL